MQTKDDGPMSGPCKLPFGCGVQFRATIPQLKQLISLVIEASTGEKVDPAFIGEYRNLPEWRGQRVGWFMAREDPYELVHDVKRYPWHDRPWGKVYPDALSLLKQVPGIEILEERT